MGPPYPELIKKEIDTLEHFRLYKPKDIEMIQRDGMLSNDDEYSYEPIDWKEFGAEITPFPMFRSEPGSNLFINELDDAET